MMQLNYFSTPEQTAFAMLGAFHREIAHIPARPINVALSGGETVRTLYKVWIEDYGSLIPWNLIHFYWVDERCVPPSHPASNYGLAEKLLLKPMQISANHIHRIMGERNPCEESLRYSALVKSHLPLDAGVPIFDFVFLGIGTDGHTSSIFPDERGLLTVLETYVDTKNPYDNVLRITMTGHPMLKACHTYFYVTGHFKQNILQRVVEDSPPYSFPASYVLHQAMDACLFASVD